MIRDYAETPVDPALVDLALENATHAPSAGFSQGWAFLVLDRPEDVRRFWEASADDTGLPDRWLAGMMRAPVVILPCSSKAAYLDRYAEPDKGHADRDESWWPMPFWHMDAAMAALLILQTATDAGLGACFFGVFREPEVAPRVRHPRPLRPRRCDHARSSRRLDRRGRLSLAAPTYAVDRGRASRTVGTHRQSIGVAPGGQRPSARAGLGFETTYR